MQAMWRISPNPHRIFGAPERKMIEGMKRYDEMILNRLLDKYENSRLYTGENKRNQIIGILVNRTMIPEYFDESSRQYETIHEQLLELEDKGLVKLCWKDNKAGHILERCVLVTEHVEEACRILKRRPKKQKMEIVSGICGAYVGRHPVLDCFLQYLTGRIELGESVSQYVDMERPEELKERIELILHILENHGEIFLREFSVRCLNDSKLAEKEIDSAAGIIARFSVNGEMRGLRSEQVLEEYSIYKNPSWVMVKGYGVFCCAGDSDSCDSMQEIALERLKGGIGISSLDIEAVRWNPQAPPKQVVTIENLTSFHRWQEQGTLAIYLGGYHNRAKRRFLRRIFQTYPMAMYAHFGDMDCGGFRIWRDLCEKAGIAFETRYMDEETYLRHLEFGKALTEHDKRELKRMMAEPFFSGQQEIFALMLKRGRKIEQECVGLAI